MNCHLLIFVIFAFTFNHRACISASGHLCPRGYLSFDICSSMNIRDKDTILADTSPSIKMCHSVEPIRGTGSERSVGVPRIILRDIKNLSYVQSSNSELWYRNYNSYTKITNCYVRYITFLIIPLRISCVPFRNVQLNIVKPVIIV